MRFTVTNNGPTTALLNVDDRGVMRVDAGATIEVGDMYELTYDSGAGGAENVVITPVAQSDDFPLPPVCPMRNQGDDLCEACQ